MLNIIGWGIAAILVVVIALLVLGRKEKSGQAGIPGLISDACDDILANFESSTQRQSPPENRTFQQRPSIGNTPVMRTPISPPAAANKPITPPKPTKVITVQKSDVKSNGGQGLIGRS